MLDSFSATGHVGPSSGVHTWKEPTAAGSNRERPWQAEVVHVVLGTHTLADPVSTSKRKPPRWPMPTSASMKYWKSAV
jgi:hypothetical protein